jgi:putative transposase
MFVAERFLSSIVNEYGEHPVSTDGGGTWYPQASKFLKIGHHIHSPYEKSIIERTIQYLNDRIENFDDCFPCKKNRCKLKHVKQWLNLLSELHNNKMIS